MRNSQGIVKLALSGVLVSATMAGAAGSGDETTRYNNMIHKDTFVQAMVDNRTSDARYQNMIDLESFVRQLGDRRLGDASYRNIMTMDAFEQQLNDDYAPPYRNVFSVERIYTVIGDPCLAEGAIDGPVLSARCEIR